MNNTTKKLVCKILTRLNIDGLFRYLNKQQLLVVMYHGVARNSYAPPFWTQLPDHLFKEQIRFLSDHYNILSMKQVVETVISKQDFPERSAMITFDDGLKNNFTVAFPVLREFNAPATIFLTMDYISTDMYLWVDELYCLVCQAEQQKYDYAKLKIEDLPLETNSDALTMYYYLVEKLKRYSECERNNVLKILRSQVEIDMSRYHEDFGMLKWNDIFEMKESGLVDFGVHTATHKILTGIEKKDWKKEIRDPMEKLSNILKQETTAFCFPNGRPGIDFDSEHVEYLNACGYRVAFTTESGLNGVQYNPYMLKRIAAGNDFTSEENYFRLNTSGVFENLKRSQDNR